MILFIGTGLFLGNDSCVNFVDNTITNLALQYLLEKELGYEFLVFEF